MKIGNVVEWERKRGEPIFQQNGRTIRPVSFVLSFWWRPYGGRVWNLPVAVEVEENGIVWEEPIVNVNLWAKIGIGLGILMVGLIVWATKNSREE